MSNVNGLLTTVTSTVPVIPVPGTQSGTVIELTVFVVAATPAAEGPSIAADKRPNTAIQPITRYLLPTDLDDPNARIDSPCSLLMGLAGPSSAAAHGGPHI